MYMYRMYERCISYLFRYRNESYKKKNYEYVAISEERLIRKKYPYTFPLHSIKYCLDHFKLKKLNGIN